MISTWKCSNLTMKFYYLLLSLSPCSYPWWPPPIATSSLPSYYCHPRRPPPIATLPSSALAASPPASSWSPQFSIVALLSLAASTIPLLSLSPQFTNHCTTILGLGGISLLQLLVAPPIMIKANKVYGWEIRTSNKACDERDKTSSSQNKDDMILNRPYQWWASVICEEREMRTMNWSWEGANNMRITYY